MLLPILIRFRICVSRQLCSFLRRSTGETSVKFEFSSGIKNRFPIFRIPETFTRMGRHLNSQRKADRSLPSTRAFPQETVNELERGWSKKPENVDRSFSRTGGCIDDTKEGKRMEGKEDGRIFSRILSLYAFLHAVSYRNWW